MLTKTSVSAVRALLYLSLNAEKGPVSPRRIAERIGESPSYMGKVTGLLAKAGILRAHRGVAGGVTLGCPPHELSLLAIVEACQGHLIADYCEDSPDVDLVCSFHQAMLQLHDALVGVLSRWTLADLMEKPCPSKAIAEVVACKMGIAVE